jgi:hypothetical protein
MHDGCSAVILGYFSAGALELIWFDWFAGAVPDVKNDQLFA